MIRSKKAVPALLALAALVAGCDARSATAPDDIEARTANVCTLELRYAIATEVPTNLAGFDPASSWLIVRDGAYVDSMTFYYQVGRNNRTYYGAAAAEERAGTYDVTVRAPGFQEWTKTGVKVSRDQCHVHDVILYPDLVPVQ